MCLVNNFLFKKMQIIMNSSANRIPVVVLMINSHVYAVEDSSLLIFVDIIVFMIVGELDGITVGLYVGVIVGILVFKVGLKVDILGEDGLLVGLNVAIVG
mmetsp:Transcript_90660/g.110965  ORF Transcript_90660/g.110965 Transcript_90660/m.110965 type:complete len:100 (+) Transcript_90660:462-761(+)